MKRWWRIGEKTYPVRLRVLTALSLLILTVGLYVTLVEPNRLVIHRQSIQLRHWYPELAGFRIALLSDFHVPNSAAGERRLREIVTATNALKPDLIVLGGDFIGERDGGKLNAAPETIAGILGELRAPHGIYAVLGNHDWWHDGEAMTAALKNVGITVLENQVATLKIASRRINLLGLPDQFTRNGVLRDGVVAPDNDAPTIVLTHAPDYFADLKLPYELTLAGHTHGGQVYLPLIGRPVVPSSYSDRYAAGLIEEEGRQLFVTVGVGTSTMRVRLFCPPEIVMLTLESKSPESVCP